MDNFQLWLLFLKRMNKKVKCVNEVALCYKVSTGNVNIFKDFFEGKKKEEKGNFYKKVQEAYLEFAKIYKEKTGLKIVVGAGFDDLGLSEMDIKELNTGEMVYGYDWNYYKMYPVLSDLPYSDAKYTAYRLANWYGRHIVAQNIMFNRKLIRS